MRWALQGKPHGACPRSRQQHCFCPNVAHTLSSNPCQCPVKPRLPSQTSATCLVQPHRQTWSSVRPLLGLSGCAVICKMLADEFCPAPRGGAGSGGLVTQLYPQHSKPGADESPGRSERSLLGVVPLFLHGQAHVLCARVPVPLCQGGVLPLLHGTSQLGRPEPPLPSAVQSMRPAISSRGTHAACFWVGAHPASLLADRRRSGRTK